MSLYHYDFTHGKLPLWIVVLFIFKKICMFLEKSGQRSKNEIV